MKTIIGKRYNAIDNSWSLNLTNPLKRYSDFSGYFENNPSLAGTNNTPPTGSTIITEPFTINLKSPVSDKLLSREFIIVQIDGTGEHAMVMYFEDGVEDVSKSDYFEDIIELRP